MVIPFKWLLSSEIGEPVGEVEEAKGQGEEEAGHGVDLGVAVGGALLGGFLLTSAPVVLQIRPGMEYIK